MTKKSIIAAILICASLIATAAFAAPVSVSIATGGTSGTYYPIGGAIAAAVSKNPDLNATAETGNAAVANTNLVAEGEIEVAFSQADVTAWAYNGELMFEGRPLKGIRTIAALYPETLQLVVSKESGIKSLADLKGKKVGVGAPGSGTEGDVRSILETAGVKYDEMSVEFLDFGGVSSRFKDNQIDAGFVVGGVPTSALMDLTTTKDVALLSFDKDTLDKVIAANPFFVANVIPAGTYRGIDTDTTTPSVMALLITSESVPEEVIYNFTKALFDNIADVQASHAMARNIKLETATNGLTAPLHPGAAKFYKEAGITVD
ncbi:MAG: TAXI family TRAP transporter solute-binding subunit [Synergistaceae bacterium]|jgi:TRAP transporter TAXI family solute receptor|nr:TAXI family TRAP transporter solute-binding subunit [Synergistaceae bacterium]